MRDMQALSDVVTLAIKAAMAPVLERLAAAEARLTRMTEAEQALGALRDRVTTVETKSAMPVQIPEAVPVDLTPALERLSAAEARLARVPVVELALGELRDRVVAMETKLANAPEPVTLGDIPERVKALEVRPVSTVLSTAVDDGLVKRISALEEWPVLHDEDVDGLLDRLVVLEQRLTHEDPVAHEKELSALRERLAVVETRAPVPGPAGPAGKDGKDGKDGVDGKDGFSLKDFSADFDGNRTMTVKFDDGRLQKTNAIRLPYMRQEGVYIEGRAYGPGDVVTWGGSQWHCNEDTTSKPGDGSKAWTLIVKRGRDGKDGRDAVQTPVVSIVGAK